jgi:multidrug resistance efflux pump
MSPSQTQSDPDDVDIHQNQETIREEGALPSGHRRIVPVVVTLIVVGIALFSGWAAWNAYMRSPWTRDGTVRAYVVTVAPEVSGKIVALAVEDNQLVRRGDLLMIVDQTDYKIAVALADAEVRQTQVNAENAAREAKRRLELNNLAVAEEQQQTYEANAIVAQAKHQVALAHLDQAQANLARTELRSPVNGYVTNLQVRLGDFANVGHIQVSVVDADSFWVDGYFEETNLGKIKEGDPAAIKLMGYKQTIAGHVGSIARGIDVANSLPDSSGLAAVNPIFTWVRLAQRIPVRIDIDKVPEGVRLVAGTTATVRIGDTGFNTRSVNRS